MLRALRSGLRPFPWRFAGPYPTDPTDPSDLFLEVWIM